MAVPGLVQYKSTSNTLGNGITNLLKFRIRLPEKSLANNCLILTVQGGGGGSTLAITDDKGNTWSVGPSQFDSGNSQRLWTFYAPNATVGTRVISIQNTSASAIQFMSATASEWYNIATSTPLEGSVTADTSGANGTGTSITTGATGTLTTGDLVLQVATLDNPMVTASFTKGSQANITWAKLLSDVHDGQVVQWGVYSTTTTFTPTMTQGTSTAWISCALRLKSAAAGTPPPATGIRVVGVHSISQPSAGTTMSFATGLTSVNSVVEVPSVGNLLVAMFSVGSTLFDLLSITESGATWEEFGTGRTANTNQDTVRCFYSMNRTPNSDAVVTLHFSGNTTNDASVKFFDVIGAANDQNDIEQFTSASGDQTVAAATITTTSITPNSLNGIVFFIVQQEFNTETGITLANALFDSDEFDNIPQDGPQNLDQNGGWAHYYNPDQSALTSTWNLLNTSTDPMRQWASYAAFFVKPPGPPGVYRSGGFVTTQRML